MGKFLTWCAIVAGIIFLSTRSWAIPSAVALFALGTIGFWVLCAVEVIVLLICLDFIESDSHNNRDGGASFATVSVLTMLLLLQFCSDVKPFTYAFNHPLMAVGYVLTYLALGVVWSIVKWWRYLVVSKERYDEVKQNFLVENGMNGSNDRNPTIPESLKDEWKKVYCNFRYEYPPRASHYKGRIIGWMSLWWLSLFWTVINDPVKRAFKAIYRELQGMYQRIADSVFKGVQDDFKKKDPDDPVEAVRDRFNRSR